MTYMVKRVVRFSCTSKGRSVPRTRRITGHTRLVAKVMVSLPDELLARVDAEAERRGTTRSAVMREYAAAALDQRSSQLGAAMRELGDEAVGHGGRLVEDLKANRPA
jgi:predicted transcriptional regulator